MSFHIPVMLKECMKGLNINKEGIYVDLTFGGGGHSAEILKRLTYGKLIAFDQDEEVFEQSKLLTIKHEKKFLFIHSNFRNLKKQLNALGIRSVDGILADLGISSHQIDCANRGFSTRFDGKLDMRMNKNEKKTAFCVINKYSEQLLKNIFEKNGEIKNSITLAKKIILARKIRPIETTMDFKNVIKNLIPKQKFNKYLAQVFQAIRIEVNEEIIALKDMLQQTIDILKPQGRLVVMTYHSLEDRLVKNLILKGNTQGIIKQDFYGHIQKSFTPIHRKPIVASTEEIKRNKRARSAKLRIAEKI